MKIAFFVILPIAISANRLLTIIMSFRCRINMFDNHSTVFRVIYLEIDELVGFCQFNPPVVSSNQLSTLDIKFKHKMKSMMDSFISF